MGTLKRHFLLELKMFLGGKVNLIGLKEYVPSEWVCVCVSLCMCGNKSKRKIIS